MSTTAYCDACGEVITSDRVIVSVYAHGPLRSLEEAAEFSQALDLHRGCFSENLGAAFKAMREGR